MIRIDDSRINFTCVDGIQIAMLIFDDVHEARTPEETLMRLRKLVSIGRLATNVVHELNNPIDGVLRYARLMLNRTPENDPRRAYAEQMVNGLTRITKMIRGTLDFTRQSRIMYSPTEIPKCIKRSLSVFNDQFSAQNIVVETEFDENIPVVLNTDVEYIFSNIAKNAVEAMPNGGTLSVEARMASPQLLEVRFSDTGSGVQDKMQDIIFDPFFTTKDPGQSVGLGLFISREIAESYNGSIEVKSERGRTTTFVIKLPVNEEGLTEASVSQLITATEKIYGSTANHSISR
jgi:two-component system NtrC family sensor kinase